MLVGVCVCRTVRRWAAGNLPVSRACRHGLRTSIRGVSIYCRARGRKTAMSTRSAPSLRRQQPDSPATCDNLPCREHAPCMLACSREAPEAVRFPGRRVRGARGGGTGAFSGEEDLAVMLTLGMFRTSGKMSSAPHDHLTRVGTFSCARGCQTARWSYCT